MRGTLELFLNDLMQAMPKYKQSVKDDIIGWIGYLDEEEVEFTHALGDPYSYEEYITLYKELQQTVDSKIEIIEIVSKMPLKSITEALDYLTDYGVKAMLDCLKDSFVEQSNYVTVDVTKEDADMFFKLYVKHFEKGN